MVGYYISGWYRVYLVKNFSWFGQALRALALTCNDLRSLWSRSNLHPSRRKFFTVWPSNPTQVEWRPLTYYQPMKYRICLPWHEFFLCVWLWCTRKLASPFGHPTQVSTQVQLVATCDYLGVRLVKLVAFQQGVPFIFFALQFWVWVISNFSKHKRWITLLYNKNWYPG